LPRKALGRFLPFEITSGRDFRVPCITTFGKSQSFLQLHF